MNSNKQKKTKSGKKFIITLVVGVIIVAALASAVFLNMDSIYGDNKKVSGFPVSYLGNDIIELQGMNSDIAVLTEKSLSLLSKHGKEKLNFTFTFADPDLAVCGKYGVIFDRRSDQYITFNTKGEISRGKSPDGKYIYLADIGSDGELLLITKSSVAACNVCFFDANGNEKFTWNCSDEYIVSTDISPNSELILCGAISAVNGEISTKAYILDTKKGEATGEYTIPGASCADVSFSGSKAVVTCDSQRVVFDTDDPEDSVTDEFASSALYFAQDSKANTAIITDAPSDVSEEYCLTLYDRKGGPISTVNFDGKVEDVYCFNERVYILDGYNVRQFSKNGEEKDSITMQSKCIGVIINEGNIYCYSLGGVEKAVR